MAGRAGGLAAVGKVLHREGVYLWYYFTLQLSQIIRYWVLGMVLGSLVAVFVKERIHGLFRSLKGKKLGMCLQILWDDATVQSALSPLRCGVLAFFAVPLGNTAQRPPAGFVRYCHCLFRTKVR